MEQRLATAVAAIVITLGAASALRAQECESGATFSGPITITTGGAYTGNWRSTDPSIPAVKIATTQPVTIANSRVRGPGDLIFAGSRSTVTVQESCFVGTNPNVPGAIKRNAIHAFEAARVLVDHCDFEGTGYYGIWVQRYLGDRTPDNTIKILNNRFHNVDVRPSDGRGGYLTGPASDMAHAIILSDFGGVPGIEIAWNQITHEPYQSLVGDSINIFDASGTQASPIQIHDNYIQGGWGSNPTNGDAPIYYGSAFTTDGLFQTDPNLTTAFVKVHDNQAVGFGNLGFAIALGHDIEMYANRVVSSGQLANGATSSTSTSHAYGIEHLNYRNNPPGVFGNNSVHDNVSGLRRQRNGRWERADYIFGVAPSTNVNNAQWTPTTAAAPTLADEAIEFLLWTQKLTSRGVTAGSHFVDPAQRKSPSPPAGLTASASGSSIALTWNAPATGSPPNTYIIEAGSSPGSADLASFSTGNTTTSFSTTGVPNGTYYVRARASNFAGWSAPSNEAVLVVGSACSGAPGAATGLSVVSIAGGTVVLGWNAAGGNPTSYVIEAGSSSGATNLATLDLGSAVTTFSASGVARGTYYVRVRGKNPCGVGPASNEVIVVVP